MGRHASIELWFKPTAQPDLRSPLDLFVREDLPNLITPQYLLLDNRHLPPLDLPRSRAAEHEHRIGDLWLSVSDRPSITPIQAERLHSDFRAVISQPMPFDVDFSGNCRVWFERGGMLEAGIAFRHVSPLFWRRVGKDSRLLQSLPPLDHASWHEPLEAAPRAWEELLRVRCGVHHLSREDAWQSVAKLLMYSSAFIEYPLHGHPNFSRRCRLRNWMRVFDWVSEVATGVEQLVRVDVALGKLGPGLLTSDLRARVEQLPMLHDFELPPEG